MILLCSLKRFPVSFQIFFTRHTERTFSYVRWHVTCFYASHKCLNLHQSPISIEWRCHWQAVRVPPCGGDGLCNLQLQAASVSLFSLIPSSFLINVVFLLLQASSKYHMNTLWEEKTHFNWFVFDDRLQGDFIFRGVGHKQQNHCPLIYHVC